MDCGSKLRSETEESLSEVLDHLLDKSITIQRPRSVPLFRMDLTDARICGSLISCSTLLSYGETESLFPYWRRELWTK
jgi:hypothetical protein